MKELIPNWLDNPRLSQVLACGLRLPGGESHVQVAGPEPAGENFDQAMQHFDELLPLLRQQQLVPGQLAWNFVGGRLYYAVRADGVALGLYCKPGSEADATAVGDFIADFLTRPDSPHNKANPCSET